MFGTIKLYKNSILLDAVQRARTRGSNADASVWHHTNVHSELCVCVCTLNAFFQCIFRSYTLLSALHLFCTLVGAYSHLIIYASLVYIILFRTFLSLILSLSLALNGTPI